MVVSFTTASAGDRCSRPLTRYVIARVCRRGQRWWQIAATAGRPLSACEGATDPTTRSTAQAFPCCAERIRRRQPRHELSVTPARASRQIVPAIRRPPERPKARRDRRAGPNIDRVGTQSRRLQTRRDSSRSITTPLELRRDSAFGARSVTPSHPGSSAPAPSFWAHTPSRRSAHDERA